ncbi:MAG TPA: hypothetical protein PLC15_02370 [Candidatus Obscuribacter sp.]|nr:hypothetical protein [Candidatus Obscuribacter sp.]MBK9282445.1 hypothetical protein [Candidatus Obscuribacter sp.]HMW90796.1 hypothetical protein [Candidatus Obscuribacter sp.]HMY02611.1 hypothetical protein [Candidatus Obscuribacter sp.]HMY56237.1 hypothetical protein [Candidatus Obscuribacter sp.]
MSTKQTITEERNRLVELLARMDIPDGRRSPAAVQEAQHLRWLTRNMFIRNGQHPDFNEAEQILRRLLQAGVNP